MRFELPPITRKQLADFAAASGDSNPIHVDCAAAVAAGHPDVIAHGMLSMAWLGRLVTSHVSQSELASFSVRFTAITPLGATLAFTSERVDPSTLELLGALPDGTVTIVGHASLHGRKQA